MQDSILDSIKKLLGMEADYTAFDMDIIIHINSVFSTLRQLGVGPSYVFSIEDNTKTWADFFGDKTNITDVKSYVYLRVRLIFDPPQTGFTLTSFQEQIKQLEWRLMVAAETTSDQPVAVEPPADSFQSGFSDFINNL